MNRLSHPIIAAVSLSLVFVFASTIAAASGSLYQTEIARGWKIKMIEPQDELDEAVLRQAQKRDPADQWLPAENMPAMIPDILQELGRIEAPWLPGRANEYQWIAENDWVYAVRFGVKEPAAASRLIFKGLDTIVDVYLNGQQIASHCNMYLPLEVDVTGKLISDNLLVLHIHSVYDQGEGKKQPIRSVTQDSQKKLVRRPGVSYGTYLGPHPSFSRVGIYDKVLLEVNHGSRFNQVTAGASLNDSLDHGTVTVDVSGIASRDEVGIRIRLFDPDGKPVAETGKTARPQNSVFSESLVLAIDNPVLWWPRGYGGQPLYRIETTLFIAGNPHQTVTQTTGFRKVTMSSLLHFVVNDVPVRMWGGNWVTPRMDTAVWDPPRVDKLFAMARHAHFNAFRIWGQTESPRDDFYERADAQGFMIWHDFTDLPLGDPSARQTCCDEARQMINRLKHHPSIFIWCGNNEGAMANEQEYNGRLEDRGSWKGLPSALAVGRISQALDPDRPYIPSSPYYGKNANDPREGDTHGYTNFMFVMGYDYLNFASEDTRIAAPPLHSVQRFMAPGDIWPEDYSPVYTHGTTYPYPKSWLKYTTGRSWVKTGPIEELYDATDAASLIHRIGMGEGLYYQDVVERQRRGRDAADRSGQRRCGGYLVWKYNDSWPQVYSGKVDYFLEPYHAYYTLRRAFAPVLLSFDKGTYIYLWAVNDTPRPVTGAVTVQLLHLGRNEVRKEIVKDVVIEPGQSKIVVDVDAEGISWFRKEHILYARLTGADGHELASAHCLADIERHIPFPDAKLDVENRNGILAITSDKYARCVTLAGDANGDAFGWFFEDNYFDLMPGQEKTVRILGDHAAGTITAKPWYSSHQAQIEWKR